jgi:transposase-like protein
MKYTNGAVPVPTVLSTPGAERSEAERSEVKRSVAPGVDKTAPDPEVVPKAQRRQFTADYKKRILDEADSAKEPGAIGTLLRREGLYSSHLTHWRQQLRAGGSSTWSQAQTRPALRRDAQTQVAEQPTDSASGPGRTHH